MFWLEPREPRGYRSISNRTVPLISWSVMAGLIALAAPVAQGGAAAVGCPMSAGRTARTETQRTAERYFAAL